MIKTKVIKRYIQTLPIQDMIVRTDHLAESIQFELVNWIENIDYGAEGWQWFIYYKTTIDPPVVTPITYTVSEDGNHVYLLWEVDHNITKRSGNLDFQIRGKRDTDKGLIEWNSSVATINLGHALDPDDHDTDENILEWYLDRMEQLAQSGIADILAERERAMAVEAELREDLDAEIDRSITKDNDLQQQIDTMKSESSEDLDRLRIDLNNEIVRSTREDIRFNSALNAEINRATNAENQIQDNLTAEILRAQEAEKGLGEDIEAETQRAEQAERNLRGALESNVLDLTNKIEAETERAQNEERNIHNVIEERTLQLTNQIEAETERAIGEETAIREEMSQMDSDLNSAIDAERERAEQAEAQLQANIDAEKARAEEAESLLQSNIEAEQARAEEAEAELQSNIDAEEARATQAEKQLQSNIEAEQARAEEAESVLQDNINAETQRATNRENEIEANLTQAIEDEQTRAEGREAELDAKIDAEINRSTLADENHDNAISQLNTDLTDAKNELQANIDAEEQRATEAEEQLQANINAEVTRATGAEEALGNRITDVEGTLTSSITNLQEDLRVEIQTRTTETQQLSQGLNNTNTLLGTTRTELEAEVKRSTDEDTRITGEIDSFNIIETESPPAGVAHRYYLTVTKDGSTQTRGVHIDIPVSDAITAGYFDEDTNELVFILSNESKVRIPFNDLIQYYDAGNGLQLTHKDEENNEFSIKFDTTAGTQGILSASVNGLRIDLSNYYPKGNVDNLLALKQNNLVEDSSQTTRYYPPVSVNKDTSIITLKPEILTDLAMAYDYSGDARAWVLNLSSTTINGQTIGTQTGTDLLGKTIRLYESLEGNEPPTEGNVLIAGKNGAYKDSTFTIAKSVPADAKFTDTTYEPVSETVEEGLFTRPEQEKLEGIQAGAEVNVQADWDAEDGDAFIRNKPESLPNPHKLILGTQEYDGSEEVNIDLDTLLNGKYDKVENQTIGNVVVFGDNDTLEDSGIKMDDVITKNDNVFIRCSLFDLPVTDMTLPDTWVTIRDPEVLNKSTVTDSSNIVLRTGTATNTDYQGLVNQLDLAGLSKWIFESDVILPEAVEGISVSMWVTSNSDPMVYTDCCLGAFADGTGNYEIRYYTEKADDWTSTGVTVASGTHHFKIMGFSGNMFSCFIDGKKVADYRVERTNNELIFIYIFNRSTAGTEVESTWNNISVSYIER